MANHEIVLGSFIPPICLDSFGDVLPEVQEIEGIIPHVETLEPEVICQAAGDRRRVRVGHAYPAFHVDLRIGPDVAEAGFARVLIHDPGAQVFGRGA